MIYSVNGERMPGGRKLGRQREGAEWQRNGGRKTERSKFCHGTFFKVLFSGWIVVGSEERVTRGGGVGREACNVTLWLVSRPKACSLEPFSTIHIRLLYILR